MNDKLILKRQVHSYTAFGLLIHSEIKLPELALCSGEAADVTLIEADLSHHLKPGCAPTWFHFQDKEAVLHWEAVGTFKVSDGCKIIVDRRDGVDEDLVAFPLLGPVLAVLLYQRDFLLMHASAVSVKGRAVCFVGDKGWGKSTTAAAMVSSGHSLLTDDIVAIKVDNGSPKVLPAFPQIKLNVDAEREIRLKDSESRPKVHDQIDKNRVLLHKGFTDQDVELFALYTLNQGDQISLAPSNAVKSLTSLLRFSYMARFGSELLNGAEGKRHLQKCSDLANRSLCYELSFPRNFVELQDVVAFIETHVSA